MMSRGYFQHFMGKFYLCLDVRQGHFNFLNAHLGGVWIAHSGYL